MVTNIEQRSYYLEFDWAFQNGLIVSSILKFSRILLSERMHDSRAEQKWEH